MLSFGFWGVAGLCLVVCICRRFAGFLLSLIFRRCCGVVCVCVVVGCCIYDWLGVIGCIVVLRGCTVNSVVYFIYVTWFVILF